MTRDGYLAMLADYQLNKLKDPKTGMIPDGIRARELEFVKRLPSFQSGDGQEWTWRGPANNRSHLLREDPRQS